MRPSAISRSSVIRAISRRTPSKLESITADGVSSMITSTPVSFSSARMLRPSRPMIRPFISSLGSSTRRVVAVARVPARPAAASRPRGCCARDARPPRFVSCLDLLQPERRLVAGLLLDVGDQQLPRLRGAQPRDPLQLAPLHALGAASAPPPAARGFARGPRAPAGAARDRRAAPRATPPRGGRAPPSARSPRGAPGARPRSRSWALVALCVAARRHRRPAPPRLQQRAYLHRSPLPGQPAGFVRLSVGPPR